MQLFVSSHRTAFTIVITSQAANNAQNGYFKLMHTANRCVVVIQTNIQL